MNDIQNNNKVVIANVIAMTQAILLSGDGAGYSIPDEYKENPQLLIDGISVTTEAYISANLGES